MTTKPNDEIYMRRCLELARNGMGHVAPNPLVGALIVYNDSIIGEGFHREFGKAHAEVHAIQSVTHKELLRESVLYVTLEPCSHHGKTPPCSDLIISQGIPEVVIGMKDPFAKVNGEGISQLQQAGCNVRVGILETECRRLNQPFFTYHTKKRPYIVLKWAQSADGFIDRERSVAQSLPPAWITDETNRMLVHKWRSENQAIMVGKNTALTDNPQLNLRLWSGNHPLRIVTDRKMELPRHLHLFNRQQPTLVLNEQLNHKEENLEYLKMDFGQTFFTSLFNTLYQRGINSLLVEGGRELLQSFIDANFWDEARIFTGNPIFHRGIKAPQIKGEVTSVEKIGNSFLKILTPHLDNQQII